MLFDKSIFEYRVREVAWTPEMKTVRNYLDDSEIVKFANFPHLLADAMIAEIECPRLENVLPDLYNAMREFDRRKFCRAYCRIPKNSCGNNEISDNDISHRLMKGIVKQQSITAREIKLIEYLQDYKSLMALACIEFL